MNPYTKKGKKMQETCMKFLESNEGKTRKDRIRNRIFREEVGSLTFVNRARKETNKIVLPCKTN